MYNLQSLVTMEQLRCVYDDNLVIIMLKDGCSLATGHIFKTLDVVDIIYNQFY